MEDKVKQVIIMRKDLKMRHGKCVAQGSHASIGSILKVTDKILHHNEKDGELEFILKIKSDDIVHWFMQEFTKVTLAVNSEDELLELKKILDDKMIPNVLITDAGHTVFNGIPTHTCIGIVPMKSSEIDKVTGHLKLF